MKPPAFEYHAPAGLGEALRILARLGPEAKVLAGGQSLVPVLNMRLAAPAHIVDINGIAGLDHIDVDDTTVTIGALVRHADAEHHPGVRAALPLLGEALRHVGHPVIRNRGTVVGSIVHADPAAELPAVLTLLGGRVRIQSVDGTRTVEASGFYQGPLESDVAPHEIATAVVFPRQDRQTATAFVEVARRSGDFALAGAAAAVTTDPEGRLTAARVCCTGVSATPQVWDVTERARGTLATEADWSDAAQEVADRTDPQEDIHATAGYRRQLTRAVVRRALSAAAAKSGPRRGGV
jgi:carbon-monoxide dehydrogenase medium subunit